MIKIRVHGNIVNYSEDAVNRLIESGTEFKVIGQRKRTVMPKIKSIELFTSNNDLRLNYKADVPDERDYKISSVLSSVPITERVEYKNEMSPVKNQGRLGSCVGFATCAMKEWQENKEHIEEVSEGKEDHRDGKIYDYSEQWLYYNCKEIDSWPNEEGTSIRCAMQVLNRKGVPTEKAWPYSDIEIGEPESWAHMISKWALGGSYYRFSTPEELQKTLVENGPCVIGIYCFYEIFYPRNGVVNYPVNPDRWYGGHAICITGWNPSTRMFTFKNSWGTGWGDRGYGYLPYEYIRDFMMDGWVTKDISVTNEMLKG